MKSGFYLVCLKNDEPISVNANDPRLAAKAIKVTKANLKVGRAKDLLRRKKNYDKVFGPANVEFVILGHLEEINTAEAVILKAVDSYRVRGNAGKKNEWLIGINRAELTSLVYKALDNAGISYLKTVDQWLSALATARPHFRCCVLLAV